MIVRSIKVAGWRCFLEETALGPFGDALNIIHAPNGTGKSSLFEAMRRALLDGHRVSGRDVEAIRPWGRQLAPRVAVELEHAGETYRITKQYLDSPSALLERIEGGRFRPVADGAAADAQIRDILTKNPPARGLSKSDNWGIAQVLWAPQGNLAIEPLSGDVVADIRCMLGAQVSGAGTGPIEKRIDEQYAQFFTSRGKLKTGKEAPLLSRLKEQLAEAVQALQIARVQHVAFEETSRRVEELRARRAQVRHDADEVVKALRVAQADAEVFRKLQSEKAQRLEQADAAEAQYRAAKQYIELIRSVEQEQLAARQSLEELEKQAPLKVKEVEDRERELAIRKAALEDARRGRESVEAAEEIARAARQFSESRKELDRIEELIVKVRDAETRVSECRERRHAHVAPDARTLKAIRAAAKERDDARLRIENSLITLEIVPQTGISVEVVAGESPGAYTANTGEPLRVRGAPETVADIQGVARLRAWGPTRSVDEDRAAQASAERRIRELTEPFGTSDPDALDSLTERAKELDARLREAEAARLALMPEGEIEVIMQRRSVLEGIIKGYLGTHPEWDASTPDAVALDIHAKESKDAFLAQIDSCEPAWIKAQNAWSAATGQRHANEERIDDARRRLQSLAERLADLTRDGKSLSEREADVQQITLVWDAARARLAGIQEQLARFADDPIATVARLEAQLEACSQEANRARDSEVREEGRLDGLCAQGTYSILAAAEERVNQLEGEIRREEGRVDAIKLLYDTVTACRAEAIAAVSAPVEAAATRILQRIAGRRLGQIQISETFTPVVVVPESVEQGVTIENLSGGEHEQLYLATRLALAEVLAREERQLVVLDDVLTATDAGRLARVMNILEEAAQRLQVLILTCHPERYRGLTHARFFDMESLASGPSV